MKTTLLLLLSVLAAHSAEFLPAIRTAGVVSYPPITIVNSAIFETDGSGNVVMTPKSVYATSASLSSYLTTATAASTYAPISTTVTLTGTQTITGTKTFGSLATNGTVVFGAGTTFFADTDAATSARSALGLGALATVTPGTNVATSLAIAADATGGIFRQGQALSATTVTASGAGSFTNVTVGVSGASGGFIARNATPAVRAIFGYHSGGSAAGAHLGSSAAVYWSDNLDPTGSTVAAVMSLHSSGIVRFGTTAANDSGSWRATNGTLLGTLAVAGASTLGGAVIRTPDAQTATTAAVSVTTSTTALTTTAGSQAITLANGTNGQIKTIVHDVDGGSAILTPATKTGFSTVTFTSVGETVTLQYFTTRGWMVVGSYGVTIAP